MTPDQIAKGGSEHAHQAALMAYCAVARLHGFDAADLWNETGVMPKHLPCSFSVGCEENGACFAKANGRPEECGKNPNGVDALEWLHAIHNQGHGDKIRGGKAKAEGVKAGVSDVFLPWPLRTSKPMNGCDYCDNGEDLEIAYCGLYIEMKKPSEKPKREGSKGGVSDEQAKFGEYAKRVGYGFIVCYSWREAVDVIRQYIEYKG